MRSYLVATTVVLVTGNFTLKDNSINLFTATYYTSWSIELPKRILIDC